jgi:hypothetical protein
MRVLWLPLLLGLSGCHLIKVNAKANSVVNINGERTERNWKFQGTLDELPAALSEAYDVFAETAAQLGKALEDAIKLPPPGRIRLRDISPSLKRHEGKAGVDFLGGAELKKAS